MIMLSYIIYNNTTVICRNTKKLNILKEMLKHLKRQ